MLSPGSVITPGNFGRVIEQYRPNSITGMASRELSFEVARLRLFPHLPSRLKALFLFGSLDQARLYLNQHAITSVIYEVELVDETLPLFFGDMRLVRIDFPSDDIAAIPYMINIGALYWNSTHERDSNIEILTESPARIIRMIDDRITVEQLQAESGQTT